MEICINGKRLGRKRESQDHAEKTEEHKHTSGERSTVHLYELFIGNDPLSIGIAVVLILSVLGYGWFEVRRTARLPHIGMVLIKNRLKNASKFPTPRR